MRSWLLLAPLALLAQSIITPADAGLRQAAGLNESDRERLRTSVVQAASQPQSVERLNALEAELWDLSLADMKTALRYADRIADLKNRLEFARSYGLQHPDPYLRERRPGQALLAAGFVVAAGALALIPGFLRQGLVAAVGFSLWLLYTLTSRDTGEFPPGSLRFLTVGFISFASAGAACVAFTWLGRPSGALRFMMRVLLVTLAAAAGAAAVTVWTRTSGVYPLLDPSWSAIMHPLAAALLAGFSAAVLAALDHFVGGFSSRSRRTRTS